MRPKFDENTESEAVPTLIRPWSRSKSRQLPCADVVASLGVLAPLRVDQSFASGSTIRRIREATEDKIGNISPVDRPFYYKAMKLSLADLYMIEGLMEGNASKIEEGMAIAIRTGETALVEAMKNDKTTVQKPQEATFPHWLMMTVLVLACNDREAMRHMEALISNTCGRESEKCMSESDSLRMLLPLTLFNSDPSDETLREFKALISEFRDFGMGTLDHWQDPFLHARRLMERRLTAASEPDLLKGNAMETSCPSLISWMGKKGWYESAK